MGDAIRLAEAITSLRQELEEARGAGESQRVRFPITSVDLELAVEVRREGEGSAKVSFWVIEAGVSGTLTSSSTQVVKLHLDTFDTVTKTQVLVAETAGDEHDGSSPGPSSAVG